jgi:hypothetical protein
MHRMQTDGKSIVQLALNAPACSLRKVEKEIDLILGSVNMGLERLVT